MNQSGFKDWKVLCWNVRGLNSEARQLAVKQKIDESGCSVVCVQETKCMHIDHRFIRKFCPRRFDIFFPMCLQWVPRLVWSSFGTPLYLRVN